MNKYFHATLISAVHFMYQQLILLMHLTMKSRLMVVRRVANETTKHMPTIIRVATTVSYLSVAMVS